MVNLIEYCLGNVTEKERQVLRDSSIPTRECRCLDHCGDCFEGGFVVKDGEMCTGDDYESVMDTVKEKA